MENKCYFCPNKKDLVSWENPEDKDRDIDYLFLVCPTCEEKLRELIAKTGGPKEALETIRKEVEDLATDDPLVFNEFDQRRLLAWLKEIKKCLIVK